MKDNPTFRVFFAGFLLALGMLLGSFLPTGTTDDTPKAAAPVPIQLTGESAQQVKDAYSALLMASKDYENAVLRAKIELGVPKDYGFNLQSFRFEPPVPTAQPAVPTKPKP